MNESTHPQAATIEETSRFIAQLLDAMNSHDMDRVAACYSPDYRGVDVNEPAPQLGRVGIRQSMSRYLAAFPNLHFTQEDTVIEGNRVALRWTARATHQGTVLHIPPTGKQVVVRGASFLTLQGGHIVSASYIWDVASMLREIGLLPEL
ncbi:MAG TPA: ester cyclase [Chloroflexia bacterium]|nr:ester cyclase [Chloroflexia bacterium]